MKPRLGRICVLAVSFLVTVCLFSGCVKKRYHILDREIYDPHKIRLRVAVPYGTSSDDMIGILNDIVNYYKRYGDWMEIWIWESEITEKMKRGIRDKMKKEGERLDVPVYPEYEPWLYESRSVYRVTWIYPGEWTVEEFSEVLNLTDSAVPRFTEDERRGIYREVLAAEQDVTKRSVSLYGRNMKIMLEANSKLEREKRQIVLNRYGISNAEWQQILKEGIRKWW